MHRERIQIEVTPNQSKQNGPGVTTITATAERSAARLRATATRRPLAMAAPSNSDYRRSLHFAASREPPDPGRRGEAARPPAEARWGLAIRQAASGAGDAGAETDSAIRDGARATPGQSASGRDAGSAAVAKSDDDDSIQRLLRMLEEAAMANPDVYFSVKDEDEAERVTGIPSATLSTRRSRGGSLPFVRRGRRVGYMLFDLLRHNILNRRWNTSDPGPRENPHR